MIADNDLLSMQYARILAENAAQASRELKTFSQERLDAIAARVGSALEAHAEELARMSHEETGYGCVADKAAMIRFVCRELPRAFSGMRCVGVLKEDGRGGVLEVGVPLGVIAAFCPSTSPVATLAADVLAAIKSGNCIVFAHHPRAVRCMSKALEIAAAAAAEAGLPEGALAGLSCPAKSGALELMKHPAVSLVVMTAVPRLLPLANEAGKPLICGGTGNGPAFIERTADIDRAAEDIILSKSFDCGTAPSAEQCVVVDACAAGRVRRAFAERGAWFMTPEQSARLAGMLFRSDGRHRRDMVGVDACTLARRAGFEVPSGTKVLVAERTHVSDYDAYNRELLAPVLPWYEEEDWMHACEKCIELLLVDRTGHTLSIHSSDEDVIRQFALKKPVARVLVNTPACLGGMGVTTDLFPSMTLGSGLSGQGMTSDNVSPMNLVYIRKVGRGASSAREALSALAEGRRDGVSGFPEEKAEALRAAIREIVRKLAGPDGAC